MAISKVTQEEIRRKAENGIPLDYPSPEKLKAYNTYQTAYAREVVKKAQTGTKLDSPNAWKNDLYAASIPLPKETSPTNKSGNITAPQKIGNGYTHVVVGENIKTTYDMPTWNNTMAGLGTDANGESYGIGNPAPGYSDDDYRQDMYGSYTDYIVQNNKIHEYPGIDYTYTNIPGKPSPPNVYVPQPYVPSKPKPKTPLQPGLKPSFAFEEQKQVTKYEYLQGIRNISISSEAYVTKSIYVTKPIQVPGNIVEIALTSKESHPLFDEVTSESSSRQTSVEYYIAYEENPALDDWHAILPEDQKEILAELLLFKSGGAADLRFPSIATKEGLQQARVYKDSVLMDKSKWSFANGGRQIQLLETYSPVSIYTIDYTPNDTIHNPWVVNIIQDQLKRIRQIDRFPNGTNRNKTVVLSNYPYVNYELINQEINYDANASLYKPVMVRLTNAMIAGVNRTTFKEVAPINSLIAQEIFTKNTTDYKTGEWKTLKPYSLKTDDRYKGFEYWHERNKLYFSETFNKSDIQANLETNHGNGTIEVEYEYLVSSFRVKIILRRNGADVNSITPVVHSYALKFKSMN